MCRGVRRPHTRFRRRQHQSTHRTAGSNPARTNSLLTSHETLQSYLQSYHTRHIDYIARLFVSQETYYTHAHLSTGEEVCLLFTCSRCPFFDRRSQDANRLLLPSVGVRLPPFVTPLFPSSPLVLRRLPGAAGDFTPPSLAPKGRHSASV